MFFFCLILIFNNNQLIDISQLRFGYKNLSNYINIEENNISNNESNTILKEKFIQIPEVYKQIKENNLTHIETIYSIYGNVGNALIHLNNLINICEKNLCKNIVLMGLSNLIKNPISYKKFNITIFPSSYKNKTKIDIKLSASSLSNISYHINSKMRLSIIRDEIFKNIPKYKAFPYDLYINIRSGDIFLNSINRHYSQPPLCFYDKIIKENNFNKVYILSNGHENPVVDILLKKYRTIKYIHGSIEFDISIIVNAYNFVMPTSTFPSTLINLNYNLKNLYIYGHDLRYPPKINFTIHKMNPSAKYLKFVWNKWNKTKEQLYLLIHENCINISMIKYFHKYFNKLCN